MERLLISGKQRPAARGDIAHHAEQIPAGVAAMMDLARAQGIIKGVPQDPWTGKSPGEPRGAVIELNVSPKKSRGDEIAATIAAFDEVEACC